MKKPRKKRDGSFERIYTCVMCGSIDNLEVNSVSGLFKCWSCHFSGRVSVPQTTPTTPLERAVVAQDRLEVPGWVLAKVEARGIYPQQLARIRPAWNGRRLLFQPEGGPDWERSVFEWDTPKVLTYSPKGLLGFHRVEAGSHVVLVEGDYKAAVIPVPWVGVAIGGKTVSNYQRGMLMAKTLGGLSVALDGGEDLATIDLVRSLWPLVAKVVALPKGCGPDDVPKEVLVKALLGAR